MAIDSDSDLDALFNALDAELQRRGSAHTEICVIGGAALNAIGLIARPTKDVDVVALGSRSGELIELSSARPLPLHLAEAATAVAAQFGIDPDWLNPGPADLIDHCLPQGFETRLQSRDYGPALTVHYAGRIDQICFKTFAAADVSGRHLTDLMSLHPTEPEMRFALDWVRQQDDSEGFRMQLAALLEYLGMNMSLQNARDALRTSMLGLLWAQWTDLGVAGTRGSGRTIVDPEALLTATLDIARSDPRLFDEVLDWLVVNGDLLDVTRLRRMTRVSAPEQQRLARAVVDLMRHRSEGSKWGPLSERWQVNEATTAYAPRLLFVSSDGVDLPVFGEPDAFFASYGFMRPALELRSMSERPAIERPACARFGARALVGIGVRAEVLLYLWTHDSAHGRLIAARSSYSQRQVSEYLAGLADAGFAERFEDGKSVQYQLTPGLRRAPGQMARYVDWARAFEALGRLVHALTHAAAADAPYESSVRARTALIELRSALPVEGLTLPVPQPERFPGETVLDHARGVAAAVADELDMLARSQ